MKIRPYVVSRDASRLDSITQLIFNELDPYTLEELKTFNGWVLVDSNLSNKIVGACLYYRRDNNPKEWYFAYLGLLESYQGQGHGTRLLQILLRKADIARAFLECETVNETAKRLYERNGFTVASTGEVVVLRRRPAPLRLHLSRRELGTQ